MFSSLRLDVPIKYQSSPSLYSFSSPVFIDLTVYRQCRLPPLDLSGFPHLPGSCPAPGWLSDLTPSVLLRFWLICRSSVPLLCLFSATWQTPWLLTCVLALLLMVVVISRWFSAMSILCPLGMLTAFSLFLSFCLSVAILVEIWSFPVLKFFFQIFFSFLVTFVFFCWLLRNDETNKILESRDRENCDPLFGSRNREK